MDSDMWARFEGIVGRAVLIFILLNLLALFGYWQSANLERFFLYWDGPTLLVPLMGFLFSCAAFSPLDLAHAFWDAVSTRVDMAEHKRYRISQYIFDSLARHQLYFGVLFVLIGMIQGLSLLQTANWETHMARSLLPLSYTLIVALILNLPALHIQTKVLRSSAAPERTAPKEKERESKAPEPAPEPQAAPTQRKTQAKGRKDKVATRPIIHEALDLPRPERPNNSPKAKGQNHRRSKSQHQAHKPYRRRPPSDRQS